MGETRNFAALEWVIGEISDTLKDARQALEAYVEDPKDSTRMRFCLTHVHQVHGSLQMVEFHGASLLAEEMEQTAQAIINNNVTSAPEAQEVLMRSLLQLPTYLEHVKHSKDDHPGVVLPLLNDLRAVRKQSFLSETNLFSPDLSPVKSPRGEQHPATKDKAKLVPVLKKLREMYQFAAASVLRGIKIDENLGYLEKVCTRLEVLTRGYPCHATWDIATALIDALRRDDLELSVAVRGLLRYLARELRILGEKAPEALNREAPESLLKNLLYYIARAEAGGQRVDRIKRDYKLDQAEIQGGYSGASDREGMNAPDPEAIKSVVVAIQEELNTVKHILDLALSGQSSGDELSEILPVIKRVGDTLAVLGIGDLRKSVLDQAEKLEELSKATTLDEDKLMEVAGKIIDVEHKLEAIGKVVGKNRDLSSINEREIEIDQAKATVINECRHGLEKAKDSIVEYISSKWDSAQLDSIGELLRDIRGGLEIIPLDRPAAIMEACNRYIQDALISGKAQPNWKSLDSLADAMASVEFYLDRLSSDMEMDADQFLDIAEQSVASLGFPVKDAPNPVTDDAGTDSEPATESPDSPMVQTEVEASEIQEVPSQETPVDTAEPVSDEQAFAEESVAGESLSADEGDGLAVDAEESDAAREVQQDAAVDASGTTESAADTDEEEERGISLDSISVADEPADEEESDIDDEIIEIFIEEAGEVRETLNEYFPKWVEDPADADSLVVVRRAFHTLKGSGRMVEAKDIGELAWSVENMLNRVIDKTVPYNVVQPNLIQLVLQLLPELITAFENKKANPHKTLTEQYMAWGHEISEGNFPEELKDISGMQVPATGEAPQAPEAQAETVGEPSAVDDDDDDDDSVLREIFSSEARSHLQTLEKFVEEMEEAAPIYTPPSDDLQRALHTLKGSAKMAQVTPIAQMAEPLEHFAKELVTYQVSINDDILQLVKDAVQYTREGIESIERGEQVDVPRLEQFLARTSELRELSVGHLIRLKELEKQGQNQVDPRLLSIFMAEEMNLLLDAEDLLGKWRENPQELYRIDDLITELKTLETGAQQANLPDMAGLSARLYMLHEELKRGDLKGDDNFYQIATNGHEALLDMVDAVAAGQNVTPPSEDVLLALDKLLADADQPAAGEEQWGSKAEYGADQMSPEQAQPEENAPGGTQEPQQDTSDLSGFPADDEPTLADEDFSASPTEDTDAFTQEWEAPSAEQETDPAGEEASEEVGEESSDDFATAEAGAWAGESDEEQDFLPQGSAADEEYQPAPMDRDNTQQTDGTSEQHTDEPAPAGHEPLAPHEQPPAEAQPAAEIPGLLDTIDVNDPDFDEDILEVFLEEANELIEELDEAVHTWESDWANEEPAEAITRALHTLKGGARLAGMTNLGELTHEYESFLIGLDIDSIDQSFFEKVHGYQDKTLQGIRAINAFLSGDAGHVQATEEPTMGGDVEKIPEEELEQQVPPDTPPPLTGAGETVAGDKTNVLPFSPKSREGGPDPYLPNKQQQDESGFVMPTPKGAQAAPQVALKRGGPQEVIKVPADLLEELVNLAGETSISRGRLEQQVSDFGGALEEIDGTIARLQEQLRRLDIETEAQILFRQEQIAESDKDFDPLEMDRYSQLQQLSRSLIESASDLADLRGTLSDNVRDTETLLLQQSRINSNLQEGLMRSRMVPFSRLVPRLRRIVRQVSQELGKQVTFELDNIEGELDRSVLERMVAPLEHMLRNAVDHGIESPEERAEAGKPQVGRIVLTLGREGGDVILRLADDGKGINLKRVREKAIERGLMSEDASLSDRDIMQFILHAGFSTAESVTQISGRGVGMDVVHAEIKQLGGSVSINSEWGKGTEFNVRLPFTVSVNRALMVELGNDYYAVPLNTIEGIVRVSPFELEHYYSSPDARFEYAGENYQVRYLGSMLIENMRPKLEGQSLPLPVLLVRSAEHTMALQVDALLGSREIVVKSLGQQFSLVQGLSGATVMGDGSVVVILDPHALVRKEMALVTSSTQIPLMGDQLEHEAAKSRESKIRTVMVVDDSVTVRKVTSRFLEREGFNVITAKDGVDALRILQDEIPDVMLLDIEMPRMDGFEVAQNIRSSQRWQDIPIIMITSRTGDKHREHAFSLGVNKYLGKPYQEETLLENINELVAETQ